MFYGSKTFFKYNAIKFHYVCLKIHANHDKPANIYAPQGTRQMASDAVPVFEADSWSVFFMAVMVLLKAFAERQKCTC